MKSVQSITKHIVYQKGSFYTAFTTTPATTATVTTTISPEPCITEQNWNYDGNDVGGVSAYNVEDCRTKCRTKPGAKYFTKDQWGCNCKHSNVGRFWSDHGSPSSGNIWCDGK